MLDNQEMVLIVSKHAGSFSSDRDSFIGTFEEIGKKVAEHLRYHDTVTVEKLPRIIA